MALAEKISGRFVPGQVVVLSGPLGAGKTAFVRGLAKGFGLEQEDVNSPSYTIVNEYCGKISLFHFDLYRITDPTELYEIGWEDYRIRDGILVVEWGEKAGALLPKTFVQVNFIILSETDREITIEVAANE